MLQFGGTVVRLSSFAVRIRLPVASGENKVLDETVLMIRLSTVPLIRKYRYLLDAFQVLSRVGLTHLTVPEYVCTIPKVP